jgi:hypothetical protein
VTSAIVQAALAAVCFRRRELLLCCMCSSCSRRQYDNISIAIQLLFSALHACCMHACASWQQVSAQLTLPHLTQLCTSGTFGGSVELRRIPGASQHGAMNKPPQ